MEAIYQISSTDLQRIVEQAVSKAVLRVLEGNNVDVFDGLPNLLKTAQVCEVLNMTAPTVARLVREGLLNPVHAKPGAHPRYSKAEVQRFYKTMRSTK
jgi:excisionase family DNA binding protein